MSRSALACARHARAEKLNIKYGEIYEHGEIDPFNGWSPAQEAAKKRGDAPTGRTLKEMGERFLKSRSHVAAATYEDYACKVGFFQDELGVSMPVNLVREEDVRAFCFRSDVSRATQTTYLRFCKMFFKWLTDEGHVKDNVCERLNHHRLKVGGFGCLAESQLKLNPKP